MFGGRCLMDRSAVFVDAGYLYAGGSETIEGSVLPRSRIRLAHDNLLERLKVAGKELTDGLPLLRIYWYDGLLGSRPSLEQSALADVDNVKMRFGTVSGGSQKGVDSLIVTDLVELARNHAISDAVIMSGDEDIRIGVQLAQSYGVRVHLIGLESGEGNQARTLLQEADTTTTWPEAVVREFLSVLPIPAKATGTDAALAEPQGAVETGQEEQLENLLIDFVSRLNDEDLLYVNEELTREPNRVPWEHDRRLLSEAAEILRRRLSDSERHTLRDAFIQAVLERLSPNSQDSEGQR